SWQRTSPLSSPASLALRHSRTPEFPPIQKRPASRVQQEREQRAEWKSHHPPPLLPLPLPHRSRPVWSLYRPYRRIPGSHPSLLRLEEPASDHPTFREPPVLRPAINSIHVFGEIATRTKIFFASLIAQARCDKE